MDYNKIRSERFSFVYIYNSEKIYWVDGTMFSRIENLSKKYNGSFYGLDIKKHPEVAGEFMAFVTPVLLVYYEKIEIIKKVRFFPIDEIKDELDRFIKKIS